MENGWTFFDNAGGSQILKSVVGKLNDFLYNKNAQTGGTYETSVAAAEALYKGRTSMARFINASRPEEIVFASSSTVALQNLAKALRSQLSEGDEVIVTISDHESNIGPWVALERDGVEVKFWNLNPDTLELDLADLGKLMTPRTKLVAVTHVSNILGTINPIAEISAFVHERGALICVDSVAFAPHRLIDVRELDVDFLVFSTYKTFGPHFAVLYGKYDELLKLDNIYHYFHSKEDVPRKLEPGNPSYELAYSLTGITDYFEHLGRSDKQDSDPRQSFSKVFEMVAEHEAQLGETFLAYLRSRNDCRIIGRTSGLDPQRVPTMSFCLHGKDPGEVARSVEPYKLAIRYGDFYARRLIDYLNLSEAGGVIRVSMVHYNTLDEVNSLVEAMEELR